MYCIYISDAEAYVMYISAQEAPQYTKHLVHIYTSNDEVYITYTYQIMKHLYVPSTVYTYIIYISHNEVYVVLYIHQITVYLHIYISDNKAPQYTKHLAHIESQGAKQLEYALVNTTVKNDSHFFF